MTSVAPRCSIRSVCRDLMHDCRYSQVPHSQSGQAHLGQCVANRFTIIKSELISYLRTKRANLSSTTVLALLLVTYHLAWNPEMNIPQP